MGNPDDNEAGRRLAMHTKRVTRLVLLIGNDSAGLEDSESKTAIWAT